MDGSGQNRLFCVLGWNEICFFFPPKPVSILLSPRKPFYESVEKIRDVRRWSYWAARKEAGRNLFLLLVPNNYAFARREETRSPRQREEGILLEAKMQEFFLPSFLRAISIRQCRCRGWTHSLHCGSSAAAAAGLQRYTHTTDSSSIHPSVRPNARLLSQQNETETKNRFLHQFFLICLFMWEWIPGIFGPTDWSCLGFFVGMFWLVVCGRSAAWKMEFETIPYLVLHSGGKKKKGDRDVKKSAGEGKNIPQIRSKLSPKHRTKGEIRHLF